MSTILLKSLIWDNNHFTIQGASLKTSGTFDFETKSSYNIYINTNDGTDNYAKAFTVSVTNVLEPITDLGFAHISKGYKFNGINIYCSIYNGVSTFGVLSFFVVFTL